MRPSHPRQGSVLPATLRGLLSPVGAKTLRALRAAAVAASLTAAFGACGGAETVSQEPPVTECPALVVDASLSIPDPPDGEDECAPGDCNYQSQTGCSEGQACRPQFNGTNTDVSPGCEPAGDAKVGDPCTAQVDCVPGAYCTFDTAGDGTCRRQCCGGDWSACDPGESCIRSLDVRAGDEVIAAGMDLCFPVGTCDLFDSESCADEPSRECKIVDPTGAVACAPVSQAQVGDPCGPPTVCSQGLNCVGGFCVKLCKWEACGEPACGPDDGACVHFERDPPGVGECTLGR